MELPTFPVTMTYCKHVVKLTTHNGLAKTKVVFAWNNNLLCNAKR